MLPKIYTRAGDDGTTTLFGAERVDKHDEAIVAMGALDELSSCMGLVKAKLNGRAPADYLDALQRRVLMICAHIAYPENPEFCAFGEDTAELERRVDELKTQSGVTRNFVTPGANELSACTDVARAVCRRAETALSALRAKRAANGGETSVAREPMGFLNRLSDYLYVLALAQARVNFPNPELDTRPML